YRVLPIRYSFATFAPIFPIYWCRCSSSTDFQLFKLIPFGSHDGLAVAAEPTFELSRVDAAEVCMELEVAGIEVRQAWVLADDAPLDRWPGHEQARACALVSAAAAVFLHAAAEFRECHESHSAIVTAGLERLEESTDRIGEIGQQRAMRRTLVRMSVEA